MLFEKKEKVSLEKKNGQAYYEIEATVASSVILIEDVLLLIEEGDHLIRTLPNGVVETYLILDRGYYDEFAGEKAHYQCKVKKVTSRELEQPKQATYNVQGNNARININSTDNSHNVVDITQNNLFDEIRSELTRAISDREQRREIIDAIDELEESQETSSFLEKYQKFISLTAGHMDIIMPFIPALTQMLG